MARLNGSSNGNGSNGNGHGGRAKRPLSEAAKIRHLLEQEKLLNPRWEGVETADWHGGLWGEDDERWGENECDGGDETLDAHELVMKSMGLPLHTEPGP